MAASRLSVEVRRWAHRMVGPKFRRMFFSINSGRAGSGYVARLLSTLEGVHSEHEPRPAMNGKYLAMVSDEPLAASRRARSIKVSALVDLEARVAREKPVYVETNHMFIKTFFDVVMDRFGPKVEILALRRNLDQVLRSFLELGYFSGSNEHWPHWMSSPNSHDAAISAIGPDREMSQEQACIAYLVDIEARLERFRRDYPLARIYEVEVSELMDRQGLESLLDRIRLTPTEATWNVNQIAVNDRANVKAKIGRSVDAAHCRRCWVDYVREASAMGIALPPRIAAHVDSDWPARG